MQLASRLRDTTLGDLLAALHRAGANGVLELIEPHARHAIHLRRGHVQAVESDAPGARLGDIAFRARNIPRPFIERARLMAHARGLRLGQSMVRERLVTPLELDDLLALQRRARLDHLYALPDAEVRFRVARPLPPGASEQRPLAARDVFHDRPRRHARVHGTQTQSPPPWQVKRPARPATPYDPRAPQLGVLGLATGATREQIRAAYKQRVLALHPDRAQGITDAERNQRARELMAVLEAYRALTAA